MLHSLEPPGKRIHPQARSAHAERADHQSQSSRLFLILLGQGAEAPDLDRTRDYRDGDADSGIIQSPIYKLCRYKTPEANS